MSDELRATAGAAIQSWVNHPYLVLPGPTDLGPELADHVATSLAGWRPPAQVISDPNELPHGSVVLCNGKAWQREHGGWWLGGSLNSRVRPYGSGPITVLHVPTVEGD